MSDSGSDDSYDPDSSSEPAPSSKKKKSKGGKRPRGTKASLCEACGASFKYAAAFEKHLAKGCKLSNKAAGKRRSKSSALNPSVAQPSPEAEAPPVNLEDEISTDNDSPIPKKLRKYRKLGPEEKNLRALRRKYQHVKNKMLNNPITRFALHHRKQPDTVPLNYIAAVEKRLGLEKSFWSSDFNFASWLGTQGFFKEYLQHTTVRIGFHSDATAPQEFNLQPFEARVLDPAHADTLINAAGPVWSSCFRPAQGLPNENRFFTVALSRIGWPAEASPDARTVCGETGVGSDYRHTLEEVASFPNVLQLWEAPSALLSGNSEDAPQIAYGIAFDCSGPIWRSIWCPHRFGHSASVLGITAVLGGDGCVRVIAVPQPPRSYEKTKTAMQGTSGAHRLSNILLVKEERVRLRLMDWTEATDRFTAVAWDAHDPLQLLCGHADGTISLWKWNLMNTEGIQFVFGSLLYFPFLM